MLSSPLGFNVQRNVKIKSIYQVIGILVGVCFNIFYITVRDVETAVCCSFSSEFCRFYFQFSLGLLDYMSTYSYSEDTGEYGHVSFDGTCGWV